MPEAVRMRAVCRTFGREPLEVRALASVDLEIAEGAFVVIRGPSGSGKTTLLNLVAGLDRPSSGVVEVAGLDLGNLGDGALSRFRNRTIGYVFQAFYLEPNRTAVDNVALPLVFAKVGAAERKRRAADMLGRVGLSEKVGVLARHLSAGQKQRVALARALVNRPALLLADEPTANLDSKTGDGILALIRELHASEGMSVLLVSHDRGLDVAGARRLWVQDGRVADGAPQMAVASPDAGAGEARG